MIRLAGGLLLGCARGWFARAHTSSDRYITALANRMVVEASYYHKQTDQMIRENERIYGK